MGAKVKAETGGHEEEGLGGEGRRRMTGNVVTIS